MPELFFSHEDTFEGEAGSDDGGVGDMQVVAGDEERSLHGDVFSSFYLPGSEREHQRMYQTTAEIIDPVHSIVIISRRVKIRQTPGFLYYCLVRV
jgi:hypothetical protein